MIPYLNKEIFEGGTAIFEIFFKDEKKNIITPKTSFWQLMNQDKTIINDRSFDLCPFTGNIVVLSGKDLDIFGDDDTRFRIFAIKATYDSTIGIDLPINQEWEFQIKRLFSINDNTT